MVSGRTRKAGREQMAGEKAKMRVSSNTTGKGCVHLGSVCSLMTGYLVCPDGLGLDLLGCLGAAEWAA